MNNLDGITSSSTQTQAHQAPPKALPSNVIGVRFQKLGKIYHFGVGKVSTLEPGDYIIAETKRGRQLGQVITFVAAEDVFNPRGLRDIDRKANPRDMVMGQLWKERELNALVTCREEAQHLNLTADIKYVKAQYNYDGSWLTVLYTTEKKKTNMSELRRRLSRALKTRVEMQLIGPRDVSKIIGGYGACGPRCSSTFLAEFSPISIKMAKEQGISLSPSEITGVCGRLRCCLVYEFQQYVEARKQLPKKGKKVITPHGEGVVRDLRPLSETALVDIEGKWYEVHREQIEPWAELKAFEDKAKEGCSPEDKANCNCDDDKKT